MKNNIDPFIMNFLSICFKYFLYQQNPRVKATYSITIEQFDFHDGYQPGFRKAHITETALIKVLKDLRQFATVSTASILVLRCLNVTFNTIDDTVLINTIGSIMILIFPERSITDFVHIYQVNMHANMFVNIGEFASNTLILRKFFHRVQFTFHSFLFFITQQLRQII